MVAAVVDVTILLHLWEFLVIFDIHKCVACKHTLTLTTFSFEENYTSWFVSVAHFDGKTATEKEDTGTECEYDTFALNMVQTD